VYFIYMAILYITNIKYNYLIMQVIFEKYFGINISDKKKIINYHWINQRAIDNKTVLKALKYFL
jgi:hypothetical protein